MKSQKRIIQHCLSEKKHLLLMSVFLQSLLLIALATPFPSRAEQPQLDRDELLHPLINAQPSSTDTEMKPLEGQIYRQEPLPVHDLGQPSSNLPAKTRVLTGKVQTLQQAMESEKSSVDWYTWYLSARAYLGKNGGINCPLETPIKFYRNGRIEALSFDPYCLASVSGRRFPLPTNTQVEALILPVRPGQGPPASPEEIHSRVKSLQFR